MTRAAERAAPLGAESRSRRDLRPRPPAANKSAGRLQTQNFHVGKSQDGRERSAARRSPARGGSRRGLLGGRRRPEGRDRGHWGGCPCRGRKVGVRSPGPGEGASDFAPQPGEGGGGEVGVRGPSLGSEWTVGFGGEDGTGTLQTCCTGATAVRVRRVGGGTWGAGRGAGVRWGLGREGLLEAGFFGGHMQSAGEGTPETLFWSWARLDFAARPGRRENSCGGAKWRPWPNQALLGIPSAGPRLTPPNLPSLPAPRLVGVRLPNASFARWEGKKVVAS